MRYESYEDDILKTFKSIDASLKTIAKSLQYINTTVMIDDNSEDAVRDFLNSLHQKNIQQEEIKDDNWDALVVYKSDKSNDGYLLKYKDRVISVSGSIDFSKKNIDFIKEKCINW